MRPSNDILITKLRKLKALTNHPESVEFVFGDMVHHHLVREAQHPEHIFRLITRLHGLWLLSLGGPESTLRERMGVSAKLAMETENEQDLVSREGDLVSPKLTPAQDGFRATALRIEGLNGYFVWHGESLEDTMPGIPDLVRVLGPTAPIKITPGKLADVQPAPRLSGEAPGDWLDDDAIKIVVQDMLLEHSLIETSNSRDYKEKGEFYCTCGKKHLRGMKSWAKHLRIQIWRYLRGELVEPTEGES